MQAVSEFLDKFSDLNLDREFAGVRLPELTIDKKHYQLLNLPETASNNEFLTALARKGYSQLSKAGKIEKSRAKEYADRAKQELATFEKLSFVDYILIVWDVINFCKENDIIVGIGRGSVGGSLIAYLIGITGIDPLEYNLLFERFVSEARAKSQVIDGVLYLDGSLLCDIDVDVSYIRRDEVIKYLKEKYPDRIAKISNFSTLTGKNLIKECGKVVGNKNEFEMGQIADMIPQIYGEVQDIAEIYGKDAKFKKWCDDNKEIYQIALKLRYLIKNKSVHASGITISHDEVAALCPIELSKDKELVAGFDMKDVAQFCIKLDILGLKTLTIIDSICKHVGIKMTDIDFKDESIYKFLQTFDYTYGIFQLEGYTEEKVTKWIQPSNINELADVLALGRPAAMHLVDVYKDNRANGTFEVIHPAFEAILKRTQGLPLYQEQLMQMVHAIGFTLIEAEEVRRIVGKKDREAVKAWEEKIYTKCKENGFDEKTGKWLWDVLNKSKDYSFNLAHAVEYAALAAMTVYLKVHYPKEFFFASLNIITQSKDTKKDEKLAKICNELKLYGIPLLPPSIKKSKSDFSLEEEGIRYGLGSVKGVSDSALQNLKGFIPDYANKFEMFQSIKQAGITLGPICSLIMAGAMTEFGTSRTKLVAEVQLWGLLKPAERSYCLDHGHEHGFNLFAMIKVIDTWVDQKGKKIARATRYNTIKKEYEKKGYQKIYKLNKQFPAFANWWYEKNILSYNYSNSLQEIFKVALPYLMEIKEFEEMEQKSSAAFVGIVTKVIDATSKNKNRYTKLLLEDGTGTLTAFAFTDARARFMADKKIPKEGDVCVARGTKWENNLRLDDLSPQSHRIFIGLADLKNYEGDNENKSNS